MNCEAVIELLERKPFESFRVATADGTKFAIKSPHSVAVMKTRLFIATPDDRWVMIPYLHVAALEKMGNGKSKRRRPSK